MIVGWLIVYLSWTLCLAFDANGFVFFVLSVLLFGVGLPMFAFGALILIFQSLKTLTIDSRALSSQDMRELLKEGKLILYPELLTNPLDSLLVGFGICPFIIQFVFSDDAKINFNFLCFTILIFLILLIRLIP